ncbi:MAG: zinc-dependent metalloprotease [Euryarchaeota archaeon]|nr:zinc-dependent metalloprotease [Euryarchaeota archaeon]
MVDIPRLVLNAGLQLFRSPKGAIDWKQVAYNAENISDAERWPESEKQELMPAYKAFIEEPTEQIIELTGLTPSRTHDVQVFDRYDWITANISAFSEQIAPLERVLETQRRDSLLSKGVFRSNQVFSTVGLSLLLGYLARKVLGQYDPSLFGRELVMGQIYFVEPNIEAVERQLSFTGEDFKRWIAIHEITHAIVFESVPWLKDHINDLLRQYFEATGEGIRSRALRSPARAVTNDYGEKGQRSLMYVVLSPTQIQLVNQIQALMSVIEGYSDFVMDRIGKEMLATYAYMKREFELRRRRKTGREVLFERVTGLGMKREQYVLGERFVSHVAAEKGMDFVNRVWRSPSDIPTLDELVRPNRWITRQESTPLTLHVTDG